MPASASVPQSSSYLECPDLKIGATAKLLISDVTLLTNWRRFARGLQIPESEFYQLDQDSRAGRATPFEIFTTLLNIWKSSKDQEASIDELDRILKEDGFLHAAALINQTTKPHVPSDLYYGFKTVTTKDFVGRESELQILQNAFNSDTEFIVVITGLGGIGKTTLARQFALHLNTVEKLFVSRAWLAGQTSEYLSYSLYGLSKELNIKCEKRSLIFELFKNIHHAIADKSKPYLLIIDNVDKRTSEVMSLLQTLKSQPHHAKTLTIVTSRDISVLDVIGTRLSLDVWSDLDASVFLRQSLSIKDNKQDGQIAKLCSLMQNYPLALQQAAAFITKQRTESIMGTSYGISNYIKTYEDLSKIKHLLSYRLNQVEHDCKTPTFMTWDITIQRIREGEGKTGTVAIELLSLMAYLDADEIEIWFLQYLYNRASTQGNGFLSFILMQQNHQNILNHSDEAIYEDDHISTEHCNPENPDQEDEYNHPYDVDLLDQVPVDNNFPYDGSQVPEEVHGSDQFLKALELLKRYSLIKIEHEVVSIHRLVQEVTKVKFRQTSSQDDGDNSQEIQLLRNILIIMEDAVVSQKFKLSENPQLHVHTYAISNYAFKNYDSLLIEFKALARGISLSIPYSQGLPFCRLVIPKMARLLKERDRVLIDIEMELASILLSNKQHDEALRIYSEHFKRFNKCPEGDESAPKDTIHMARLVAATLDDLDRDLESLIWWKKHLKLTVSHYGDKYDKVIWALERVRDCMERLKRWEEALKLHEEIFDKCCIYYGEWHDKSIAAAISIAQGMEQLKRYEEALTWWEKRLQLKLITSHKNSLEVHKAIKDWKRCRSVKARRQDDSVMFYEGFNKFKFVWRRVFLCGTGFRKVEPSST